MRHATWTEIARFVGAVGLATGMTLAAAPQAQAASCSDLGGSLTCNATGNGDIGVGCNLDPFGLFCSESYAQCGAGTYDNGGEAWAFSCLGSGPVTVTMSRGDCDIDMFVLDGGCAGCEGSNRNGGNIEEVVFTCIAGQTFFFVVERAEAGDIFGGLFGGGDCSLYSGADYSLTTECVEVCTDRIDNDGDGFIDCLDIDCGGYCDEICDNLLDDDFDGLADCFDPDCADTNTCCDKDGDGFRAAGGICGGDDCNDAFPSGAMINPGAAEIPGDNVDQDCDGFEDCFVDNDRDAYGVPTLVESRVFSCLAPGVAPNDDDCDDTQALVNPGAPELIANGRDDNCDTTEDCWEDVDNDNWGSGDAVSVTDVTCSQGPISNQTGDCNDNNAAAYPGAPEIPATGIDEDCDGYEDCYSDNDGDAYGTTTTRETSITTCIGAGISIRNDDCNDTPGSGSAIHPNAPETQGNGIDQDCDGFEDCFLDGDNDDHGKPGTHVPSFPLDCTASGVAPVGDDCDDLNATVYPGATDPPADGIDQNCDNAQDCYRDLDGDGWGSSTVVTSTNGSCIGTGISPRTGDCADTNNAIYPTQTETPNNAIDQDCDGFEDCYEDQDGDSYGSNVVIESVNLTCIGAGSSNNRLDCDDTPPDGFGIKPGATEIPNNGIDENCDGAESCYLDQDNDTYGRAQTVLSNSLACAVAGVSSNALDCNDTATGFRINPGATEQPVDNLDQNCDGLEICYVDADGDTFGSTVTTQSPSIPCSASGVANDDDDCDDNDATEYPGSPTPGKDCSGVTVCYQDADFDGYGGSIQILSSNPLCNAVGQSPNSADCNDGDATVKPNVVDAPNDGIDKDCDGYEICYQDLDNDGFGTINPQPSTDLTCNATGVSRNDDDCNDNPGANGAAIYPGATEIPASDVDENCDGFEDCYRDDDRDDYGHATRTIAVTDLTCQAGSTWADNNLDCDDANATRKPSATEIPVNGIDENCDLVDQCYQDLDGDAYGSTVTIPGFDLTCVGVGVSRLGTDCFDLPPDGASVYPGAPEIAGSGIDENCDGRELCYLDQDRDGYGQDVTISSTNLVCLGSGLSSTNDDCNDQPAPAAGPQINPGVAETAANGVDQDCDGYEDCYQDLDRDQYGSTILAESSTLSCIADGVAANDDDCYDLPPTGASIRPGAVEVVADGIDQNCDNSESCYRDIDNDGYGRNTVVPSTSITCSAVGYSTRGDDCNDAIGNGAPIHPDAIEVPVDGVDQDCDALEQCYRDGDGDTFGVSTLVESPFLTCVAVGVSTNDDDCNDVLPGGNFIYPTAVEIPGNGIDENCDGVESCFLDNDGDGFGGLSTIQTPSFDCNAPNATFVGGDCDDARATVNPDAVEIVANNIDEDCDGVEDCYRDADKDGYGSTIVVGGNDLDCADLNESPNDDDCVDLGTVNGVRAEAINPGETEICNDVDDDCDGDIDDDDPNVAPQVTWYLDVDGDGYGIPAASRAACEGPVGYAQASGDCNDGNAAINPGEQEICDPSGADEDCNGLANENDPRITDTQIFHPDSDADGFGSADLLRNLEACFAPPGYILDNSDCDDFDPLAYPGGTESPYDGSDNDCEPATPDDDLDEDGYPYSSDCNDVPGSGESINPGTLESPIANGVDDDCDGAVDEGTTSYDDDGDGFAELGGDCNDAAATVAPDAFEVPDGQDNDCDGIRDEGTTRVDDDGDGWSEAQGDCADADAGVNPGQAEIFDNGIDDDCDGSVDGGTADPDSDGYTPLGGDCDDSSGVVFPNAPELPDGLDNDCDGVIDEGTTRSDDDGDGFSEAQGDCNDVDDAAFPTQTEQANGVDDDCDGVIDEGSPNADDDGDGYAENQGDCNDAEPAIFPGQSEIANGVDDDCNGTIDDGGVDVDGDGWTTAQGDCDDTEGWARPDAVEVCDGIDNDCDGVVDDGLGCGDAIPDDTGVTGGETGCGCASTTPTGWLAVFAALALARRRRVA